MTHIDPKAHGWMMSEDVNRLFSALPKGSLRFVGGCVRNALLGEGASDIDLACQLEPNAVIAALDAASIRSVPTGIDHGTITAVIEGKPFEITSLRKDVETDGRRAVVAFTTDWGEDAQRRDFNINALYANQEGRVFDPLGAGLDDLQHRRFRFVGEAGQRVREDYLRILRYFRFLAYYGDDQPLDKAALRACREHKDGLKSLSVERILSELKKLLSGPHAARIIRLMLTQDILDTLLPESSNAEGLERLSHVETHEHIAPDPLLRLMSMSARDGIAMARLSKRLHMSKQESRRLTRWALDMTPIDTGMEPKLQRAAIFGAGKQVIIDRAILRAAGAEEGSARQGWMDLAHYALEWPMPDFPLSGDDLKSAGVEPGPKMGRIMEALTKLWIRSDFSADKDKLLMALSLINR